MKCLLFLSLFSISCSCSDFIAKQNQIPDEERVINRTLKKAAAEIQSHSGLIPCGFGGGTNEGVWMLALSFNYYHEASVEDARKLLLSAIENFLKVINNEEEVSPYLKRYPFEPNYLEVRIFFYGPKGIERPSGKLAVLSFYDGVLHYRVSDGNDVCSNTTETYEEALAIASSHSAKK